MKQQIIISGRGGQGVLFLTRLLAEAAVEKGMEVLTSETHGMAMRGGTVVSHVKVGPFKSPSVRKGHADAGLFLASTNVDVHKDFLKPGGLVFVNTAMTGDYMGLDATGLAKENGSIIITNLVLLGYVVRQGGLFCDEDIMISVIHKVSNSKNLDMNLKGFEAGFNYQGGVK